MTDTEFAPAAGPRPLEPLHDVRVIDLTRILAGPYATMILGDLGADVVKIERPGHGDDTRHWGPPFVGDTASYYTAVNRNKRSIAIDLKHEQGRELVLQMLGDADVVVSNFRPGVMDRLGLGQAQLAQTFPGLIRCSITGHAPDDPRAQQPSVDLVIQAETGLMDLTGQADGPATKVGISIADELAGLYLVQGVLAALYHRERTGEGRTVNVALNEAVLSAFTYQAQKHLVGGGTPRRMGNDHPSLVPYRAYRAADGDFVVGVANEGQWRRFCSAIDRSELIDDARFATNTVRVENRVRLELMLESRLVERTREHWIAALRDANVPCGLVRTVAEAIDTEIALDTGLIGDGGDGVPMVGSPIRIDGAREPFGRPSPALGEHTDEVLAELGLSAEQIAEFRTRGVVA
jgi:crotonobetainyl-CoA:carnitine CoA-transferase CaiB-like acyl-CoA transferase